MDKEDYQNTIINALEENELDEAYRLLMSYFDKFGSDYFYSLSLSDILLRQEEYYDVIILLNEYADHNDLLVNERLADAYLGLGLYEDALKVLDSLPNEDNPDLLHSFYIKGMAYYLLEKFEDALQYFEDILLETEDRDTLYVSSLAYGRLGKNDRSVECIEKLRLYPSYLAELLGELLEYGLIDIFERSLIYLEDVPALYYRLLASLKYYHSEFEEAISACQTSLEYEKSIRTYFLLMSIYSQIEDQSHVQMALKDLLDLPVDSFDMMEFFLMQRALDLLYPEYSDQKAEYIRSWMGKLKTSEAYFDLGDYLVDHLYSDLLNELLNDVELPLSFYLRDTYRYQNLTADWYFMNQLYQEALDYLLSIDYRGDTDYFRYLALCTGFMEQWDKTLYYAKSAMPDGIAAVLGIQAAAILKDEQSKQFFADSMEKSRGSVFESNMYCYDNYLENGLFLLPEHK